MSGAIADKLDEARALIEKGWCRETFAKDARGEWTFYNDPDACHFCSLGAIRRVVGGMLAPEYRQMTAALARVIDDPVGIANFNDRQKSKRPVLAAFKRAAELARGEAA